MIPVVVIPRPGEGPALRLAMRGDLESGAAAALRRALSLAEDVRPPLLALDLRRVDHVGWAGLRAIVDASHRARDDGRRLVVVPPPDGPVGRVLELTLVGERMELAGALPAG